MSHQISGFPREYSPPDPINIFECQLCTHLFNDTVRLPKILVGCGHTYCQQCILRLIQSTTAKCPECHTAINNPSSSSPQNLVLLMPTNQTLIRMCPQVTNGRPLNMQPSNFNSRNESQMRNRPESAKGISFQQDQSPMSLSSTFDIDKQLSSSQQTQNSQMSVFLSVWSCTSHITKTVEAFCQQCVQPLCIDCILTNKHKTHSILSLKIAAQQERDAVAQKVEVVQQLKQRLKTETHQLEDKNQQIHQQYVKMRELTTEVFHQLRMYISGLEQQTQQQLQTQFTNEQTNLKTVKDNVNNMLNIIEQISREGVRIDQSEEDYALILKPAQLRKELLSNLERQIEQKQQLIDIQEQLGSGINRGIITSKEITKFVKELKLKLQPIVQENLQAPNSPFSSIKTKSVNAKQTISQLVRSTLKAQRPRSNSNSAVRELLKYSKTQDVKGYIISHEDQLSHKNKIIQSKNKVKRSTSNSNLNYLISPHGVINIPRPGSSKSKAITDRKLTSSVDPFKRSMLGGVSPILQSFKSRAPANNLHKKRTNDTISFSMEKPLDEDEPLRQNYTLDFQNSLDVPLNNSHQYKQEYERHQLNKEVDCSAMEDIDDEDEESIIPAQAQNTTVFKRITDLDQSSTFYIVESKSPQRTIRQLSTQRKRWFEDNPSPVYASNQSKSPSCLAFALKTNDSEQPLRLAKMNSPNQLALSSQIKKNKSLMKFVNQRQGDKPTEHEVSAISKTSIFEKVDSLCEIPRPHSLLAVKGPIQEMNFLCVTNRSNCCSLEMFNIGRYPQVESFSSLMVQKAKQIKLISIDQKAIVYVDLKSGDKNINLVNINNRKDLSASIKSKLFYSLPQSRINYGIASCKGKLVVSGGIDTQGINLADNSILTTRGEWESSFLASLSSSRERHVMIVTPDKNQIFIIGGTDKKGNILSKVERLKLSNTSKWVTMAPMLNKRIGFQAIALPDSNSIIVIGGFDGHKTLNSVEVLDIDSNQWHQLSSMSTPRQDFGAFLCPTGKYIYVVGGQTAHISSYVEYRVNTSIERYCIATNGWEIVCQLPPDTHVSDVLLLQVKNNHQPLCSPSL